MSKVTDTKRARHLAQQPPKVMSQTRTLQVGQNGNEQIPTNKVVLVLTYDPMTDIANLTNTDPQVQLSIKDVERALYLLHNQVVSQGAINNYVQQLQSQQNEPTPAEQTVPEGGVVEPLIENG